MEGTSDRDGSCDIPFMDVIKEAIENSSPLKIKYISAKNEETERTVEPFGILYESFKWNLFSYCRLRKETRFFRLDRIKELKLADGEFQFKDLTDVDMKMIDTIKKRPMNDIILRFTDGADPSSIRRRCFFGITGERETENGIELSLRMEDMNNLANWIIPYRGRIKVLHPKELKDILRDISKDLHDSYCQ